MTERPRLTLRHLIAVPAVILIAVTAVLVVSCFALEDAAGRVLLLREIEKGLVELAFVAVIGGLVALFYSRYQAAQVDALKTRDDERQRDTAKIAVQTEKVRRLVDVANRLRLVPSLIEAHRSAKTYGEQMRGAIDARLELHRLKHELGGFGEISNTLFPSWPGIRLNLETMVAYLEDLEQEFRREYAALDLQAEAEKDGSKKAAIWSQIKELPLVADLLALKQAAVDGTRFAREFLTAYRDAISLMQRDVARQQQILL